MKRLLIPLAGVAVASAILLSIALSLPSALGSISQQGVESGREVTITVQEGDTISSVSSRLQHEGVIDSALAFRIYARITGRDGQLAVGEVKLRTGMSYPDVLDALAKASPSTVRVTIPEGLRLEELAERLVAAHVVSDAQEFVRAARAGNVNSPLVKSLSPDTSLEGYLFPDTYDFEENSSPLTVVRTMVANLERKLGGMPQIAGGLPLHDAIILASIVEREARVPDERPVIASVYLNRLRAGMRLQADPTVQYALGVPGNWWKHELTLADLQMGSPYNTYLNAGLPPGPICNPGLASIEAVLFPADTDYLYFVAKGDGTHAFARTLEEHEGNVRKYQSP